MTLAELDKIFKKHHNEYLRFDRVVNKRCKSADANAFQLLSEIFPDYVGNVIVNVGHDELFLFPDLSGDLPFNESQIVELVRCGVRYVSEYNCFLMFVG